MGKKIEGLAAGDIHWGHNDPEMLYRELKQGLYAYIEKNRHIDYVFIQGDYFHKKLSATDIAYKLGMKFFYELLTLCSKYKIKLRALRGTITHDYVQLDVFKAFEATHPNFRLINSVEVEELFPDVYVLYLPEEYPENQEEYYREFLELEDDQAYDLISGHGTFKFQAFSNQVIESERPHRSAPVFDEKLMSDIAIGPVTFGHIHIACDYREKIYYHGSYSRDAMGEEAKKGFLHVTYDTEDGEYDVQFVENTLAPIYLTVDFGVILDECEGDESAAVKKIEELKGTCFKLRVRYDKRTDDDKSVAQAEVLRSFFSSDHDVQLLEKKKSNIVLESDEDTSILSDGETEEEPENELAFLLEEGGDITLNIRDYLLIKHGIDYHKDDIADAITERKDEPIEE